MSTGLRIAVGVTFSVLATLAAMRLLAFLPGMQIEPVWWLFGAACPLAVSLPVCTLLVRRWEENRRLAGQLEEALAELRRQARIDRMTGLLNRGALMDDAGKITSGWVLLLDVDHFKMINDVHGHHIGDVALQEIARILDEVAGTDHTCGRLGGEEFAVLMPGSRRSDALELAEALRTSVSDLSMRGKGGMHIRPTISVGLGEILPERGFGAALRDADDAMYAAKRAGRNRVSIAA